MGGIFGEFGPRDDLSPIVLVCLLLPGCEEVTHFFLCDATEEEEESCEHALIRSHRDVDGGRYLRRGKESIGDVGVSAERGHVVAAVMGEPPPESKKSGVRNRSLDKVRSRLD